MASIWNNFYTLMFIILVFLVKMHLDMIDPVLYKIIIILTIFYDFSDIKVEAIYPISYICLSLKIYVVYLYFYHVSIFFLAGEFFF